MAKLFITLYLMVIASFAVFILYIVIITAIGDNLGSGSDIEKKVSKGTLQLLDQSLDGLNKEQTRKQLDIYKKLFNDEFRLSELSTMQLDKEEIAELKQGKLVFKEEENIRFLNKGSAKKTIGNDDDESIDIVYYKRANSSLVWRVHFDYELNLTINQTTLTTEVHTNTLAKGMMYLLQKNLPQNKQKAWPELLKKLEPDFGLPLILLDSVTINEYIKALNKQFDNELDSNAEPLIKTNEVSNITQGTNFVTIVQKIPNSDKFLQVGPVEIPWYVRNYALLSIIAFILAFATTLLLWLWPFWSNLVKIKKAADDFGAGQYDTRISASRWSPIKKISNAFNVMAAHTQNSIRQQKELTSAVSHELRTPVARMRFALEMLDSNDSKLNQTDKSRYINDINEDIDELDLLLEELLTYARFDQQNHTINQTINKLIPWLSDSMEKLMPLAKDKVLHYKIEGIGIHETNVFEPRLMTRVLDNLVQNALRYANQSIDVTLCKDHDDYLLIVEDDGTGIAKDKRSHIFDAFSRIDASRDRASGGFGLGLAIVDKIVKAHSGKVTIHDSPLGGARFEVRIPAQSNI